MPKFIHYAAHAETLGAFLEALGVRRMVRVRPGTGVFFEYFKKSGEYYIRIFSQYEHEQA